MITSFFKTSKPFHFIVMSFMTLILFVWYRKDSFLLEINSISIVSEILIFLALIFSLGVLTFIVSKNSLTQKNSYHILFFVLFLALMPASFTNNHIVVSNLFVLLAFRRLISLKSYIDIKKKLFDAAFWIGVASLFYFWAILFFPLIFIALIIFSIDQIRNWVIPFLALFTLFILMTCFYILFKDSYAYIEDIIQPISLDFTVFNSLKFVISITLFISVILWTLFYYLVKLRDVSRIKRSTLVLVFYYLVLAIAVVVVTNNKSGSEFIFLFTPLAVIASNYVENIEGSWFSEVFIGLIFVTSIAILLL